MKETKSMLYLHTKIWYGFQNLGVHNKYVGIHLYVVHAICRTWYGMCSLVVVL